MKTAVPFHEALRFADRADAGRALAEKLRERHYPRPFVLGMPRGGVEVAYEVAISLDAPLDIVVVRKLGAPGHAELGIGAVGPDDVLILNPQLVQALGLRTEEIARIAEVERREVERQLRLYRGDRPRPDLRGHTTILVDDGLATGVTARAAVHTVWRWGADRVVLGVPACAAASARALRGLCDEVVCVLELEEFWAVGVYYRDFSQVTDEQVRELLRRAWEREVQPATPAPARLTRAEGRGATSPPRGA
jgi:predicted phosphoribosyltransferase